MDITADAQPVGTGATRWALTALGAGVAGAAVAIGFGFRDGWDVFFRSYLLNYAYVISLALGGLFFVILQHLTRAGWSAGVRRAAEFVVQTLPWLALAFLPLLVPVLTGMKELYPWTNADTVAHDEVLQAKAAYLNVPFFLARCVAYFGIWLLLARFFVRTSLSQDTSGDVTLTQRMQWWSAPGMLLYAITVTFFAVDLLMTLNPHWFSTIWGVYYFAGSAVGFFAVLILLVRGLQRAGRLRQAVNAEHFHDLGKLAFGFVIFWAYIAFSQYMLIWYANVPEETVWYMPRQADPWWIGVSLVLLFGHFFVPFLALISRVPKRRPALLSVAAVWLLAVHWLDLYYLVIPRPLGEGVESSPLHVSDIALLVALGGFFTFALLRPLANRPVAALRDPRLHEALRFENV